MNWLDLLIIALIVGAIVRGRQLGVIQQVFSTGGFLLGLFLGALMAHFALRFAAGSSTRALLAVLFTVGLSFVFLAVGEISGRVVKHKVHKLEKKYLLHSDKLLGSAIAVATLLAAVWLSATLFLNAPIIGVQNAIRSSRIVAVLSENLPSAPQAIVRFGNLIDPNNFPKVFIGLEPRIRTDTPLPDVGILQPAVQKTRVSVVRISGIGCGGVVNGSGWVAADNLVVTNAHVVAGVGNSNIHDAKGTHSSSVIWFDPELDLAILRTNGLAGKPLPIRTTPVLDGTPAAVAGYPGGGDFTVVSAAVVSTFNAKGKDIYNQKSTTREVYSLQASVQEGNSGGPLIDKNGQVIGVIFAESSAYKGVGYALTMQAVSDSLNQARQRSSAVPTGSCAE